MLTCRLIRDIIYLQHMNICSSIDLLDCYVLKIFLRRRTMVSGKFDSNKDYIHTQEDIVEVLENTMPQEEVLYDLAELFKVFGDSTRIRILYVLFETEMCVYDLSKILNVTQSAISHQLRVLKQNKLVKFRREGKNIFYSLADEHVRTIINQGMEHIEE
ncbi:transcriptional regulator, ArsR family [Filifactor alocis ATCC 35896]|uniref:Transcriptional regulator, ArsR family n=2 Tax=Filifactor TaxID=44259 RepID=D6GSD0_FILAD|nr:transcriptional regulator, ArsR family [Filifactor alocis ATCC 35896]